MGLGIAGTLTEIGRIKKADMKGLDDLIVGLLLTVVSVVVKVSKCSIKYWFIYSTVTRFVWND